MFRYIFAHGYFFEILNLFQILDFLLQRQMVIATLLECIFRVVNVEPLLNPSIHTKELYENLIALNIVKDVEIYEVGNEWRQS